MSYRSHRSRDRDRLHSSSYSSSHKYEHRSSRYEDRHRRDDSYYSSSSRKRSHRDRSRSKHRSRSHSKHHDDHYRERSSQKSRDYKELSEPKHEKRHETDETVYKNHLRNAEASGKYSLQEPSSYDVDYEAKLNSYQSTDFDLSNGNSQSDTTSSNVPMDLIDDEDPELKAERERVQKETMERLQKHLQSEGKHYPAPRPQASHPIFANDGSFLEMFKSMQNILQSKPIQIAPQPQIIAAVPKPSTVPRQPIPTTIKRRGGKILKTGIVQKQRNIEETDDAQPTDSWNAYLKEVKRYKNVTCGDDNMTRPLVK